MNQRIFLTIVISFLAGILLRSFVFISLGTILLCLVFVFICIVLFFLLDRQKIMLVIAIGFLFFTAGMLRFHIADLRTIPSFDKDIDRHVSLIGSVVSDPDNTSSNERFILETDEARVLVRAPLYSHIKYGYTVEVGGTLSVPANFETDQGKTFDYESYLAKDDIFYILKADDVKVIDKNGGNRVKKILFRVKHYFLNSLETNIPSPAGGLMAGIIIGDKSWLSNDLRNNFIATGTIHIIALSGYNVTIVAEGIMKVLGQVFARVLSISFGIITIILFVIMTGGSATAIRAGVMAVLALMARATGRTFDIGRALLIALLVMVMLSPKLLAFDVSFQLSFIATFGLIYLTPIVYEKLKWITARFGFREIIASTIATNIFVLPFIVYKMGTLSIIALPANILILPLMPLTMLLGFAVGILGGFSHIIALPFSYIAYGILSYMLAIIHFLSKVPFASFSIKHFPIVVTLILYAIFGWYIFIRKARPQEESEAKTHD